MDVKLNKEIRKEVVESLRKYQWCLHALEVEDVPSIGSSSKLVWPGHVSKEKREGEGNPQMCYVNRIVTAVNRLSEAERELIIKRHLLDDEVDDRSVYEEMLLSRAAYYELKKKALSKLAMVLGMFVE